MFVDPSISMNIPIWKVIIHCSYLSYISLFHFSNFIVIYVHVKVKNNVKNKSRLESSIVFRGMYNVLFLLFDVVEMQDACSSWNHDFCNCGTRTHSRIGCSLHGSIAIRMNRDKLDKAHQWIVLISESTKSCIE